MKKQPKDSPKPTKLEKTGDHTFNVHLEDGGHVECNSQEKLSNFDKVKNKVFAPSQNTYSCGVGDKKDLVCDKCKQHVTKAQGIFDKAFKKILYICTDCNFKTV